MRKIICLLLIMMLSAGALAERAPGNHLGLGVLSRITSGDSNQFVSPVSLAYALSMAAAGAATETATEIYTALEAAPEDVAAMNDPLREAGLNWANAVFVRKEFEMRQDYIDRLDALFEAEWFSLDDAAADRANAWVSDRTDGMIDRILDGEPDTDARLILMNAVAMDAHWRIPFEPENTWRDVFHTPGGDVQAYFMHKTMTASYGEWNDAQVLCLEYENSSLKLWLILPPEGGEKDVLAALAESDSDSIPMPESQTRVKLSLPKLDVCVENRLGSAIQDMGVTRAFSGEADFSCVNGTEELYISDVIQKVRVQVDEAGTRAAAATTVTVATCAMEEESPVPVNLNRPFILHIADEVSGVVCFAGLVTDPTK